MPDDSTKNLPPRDLRRVIVLGAGALGSLLGGKLSRRLPVVLVTRGAHLDAIRRYGLRLGGLADAHLALEGNLSAVGRLAELPEPPGERDLVLLTVKAPQVKAATAELTAVLRAEKGSLVEVLSLQNGTGFECDLRAALEGLAAVRMGVAFAGATLIEPGVVEEWGGEVYVPFGGLLDKLVAAWRAAGQSATAMVDVEFHRWEKIVFNCALNAFSAILDARNNETIRSEWRPLRRAILREGRAVARAEGVLLPDEDRLLEAFERRAQTSRNVNSMLQDIQRGRPTEIEFLNGAMVRSAVSRGRQAPANAAVEVWIRRLETAPSSALGELRHQAVTDLLARDWA